VSQKRTRVKWKKQWHIQFWMIQNPLSPNYQTSGPTGSGTFRVDGKAEGTPEAMRVERERVFRSRMGPTFRSKSQRPRSTRAPDTYVSVTPTATHHHGRQAAAEVALMGSAGAFSASVMHNLWRAITQKQNEIALAIMEHGGVMIVGRVVMSQMANPDTGMKQALFKDIYLAGAAPSWEAYERAEDKPDKSKAFVGPPAPKPKVTMQAAPGPVMRAAPGPVMKAALFPGPDRMIHTEPGQVLEHFFVWADKATGG
jgi:hypothetical protein